MKLRRRIEITARGYRILREYCPGLIRAKLTAALAETLAPFAAIWFSARIVNEIAGARSIRRLTLYVLTAVGISFVLSMVKNAMDKVVNDKQSGMFDRFARIFSDKQMRMDYADLEDAAVQHQKQEARENLFMFGNGLGQLVWDTSDLVTIPVGILASVSLTASLFTAKTGNAVLDSGLWVIFAAGLMAAAGVLNARLRKKEQDVFETWTAGSVWFNRAFSFYGEELAFQTARAKDVRLYRQDRMADRQMEKLEEHHRRDNGLLRKMSGCQGRLVFGQGLLSGLCCLYAAAKAGLGAFPVGNLVQYVGALVKLVESFGNLVYADAENRVYTQHLEGLFEYLDLPERKRQGNLPVDEALFRQAAGEGCEIEFRNVSFRYPGSREDALHDVSTRLRVGKRQALVGANGAGKTTFVKLLCRLYDPTEGEILLNGVDIRQYDYEDYLRLFSFVFQDFRLFALPLGQNIAADTEVDAARAEAAMEQAAFSDQYRTMERGLDTFLYRDLSPDGVEISGGEAQKIALARAIYRDAPVIVLDEPTAALDPRSEEEVYTNFSTMVKDRTAVYISHRLSSCRFCDEITVFDRGRIVQKGTHETLLKETGGKYRELWDAQAQYYRNT